MSSFVHDRFPPYDGEEEQINPGLWGKRLAEFLRDNLGKEGFGTEEPIAEDWGWMVPVANEQFRLWIGCGHYQEYRRISLLHRTAYALGSKTAEEDRYATACCVSAAGHRQGAHRGSRHSGKALVDAR